MPGAQGAAGAGHYPKLAGDPALVSWQYVALTVLHGKNGMPAFGQQPTGEALDFLLVQLSDAQVAMPVALGPEALSSTLTAIWRKISGSES